MKWVVVGLSVIVGCVLLVVGVGYSLPQAHRASSSIHLSQPPDSVWAVVRSVGEYPTWWSFIERAERSIDADGREVWEQIVRPNSPLPMVIVEDQPPRRFVSRIIDDGLPYGGTWTYEVTPANGGSTVIVTEDGMIYNPIFRVVSRFVLGYHRTMDGYLTALARRFGQSAVPAHRG